MFGSSDEDEPLSLQYTICFPTNCQGHAELTKQALDRMWNGKQMLVAVMNMQQKPMTFLVPLNGFAKTSDGATVDEAKYQETRSRMMEFAKKEAWFGLREGTGISTDPLTGSPASRPPRSGFLHHERQKPRPRNTRPRLAFAER